MVLKLMVCSTGLRPPDEQTELPGMHSSAQDSTAQSQTVVRRHYGKEVVQPQAACVGQDGTPVTATRAPPSQMRCAGSHCCNPCSIRVSSCCSVNQWGASSFANTTNALGRPSYPAKPANCTRTRRQRKNTIGSSWLCRNHCAATCCCKGLLPSGLIQGNRTCMIQS